MANLSDMNLYKFLKNKEEDEALKEFYLNKYVKKVLLTIFEEKYSDDVSVALLGDNNFRVGGKITFKEGEFNFPPQKPNDIMSFNEDVAERISDYSDTYIEGSNGLPVRIPPFTINNSASVFNDTTLHKGEFELIMSLSEPEKEKTIEDLGDDLKKAQKALRGFNKKQKELTEKVEKVIDKIENDPKVLDPLYEQVEDATPDEEKERLESVQNKIADYVKEHKQEELEGE